MSQPVLVTYIHKNVYWKEVFKILLVFSITFGLAMSYLSLSSIAGIWNSLWVSTMFALVFTTLFYYSIYIRCATAVFFLQCGSPFGLVMIFLSISWIAVQEILEGFISIHAAVTSEDCGNRTTPFPGTEPIDYETVKSLVTVLHYVGSLPYFLIFLYSVLYVFTFSERNPSRTNPNIVAKNPQQTIRSQIYVFVKHVMSFAVGSVFSLTVTAWVSEKLHRSVILASLTTESCASRAVSVKDTIWITVYLTVCVFLVILVPFTNLLISRRHRIIEKYFEIKGKNQIARKMGKNLLKPKGERVTFKMIRSGVTVIVQKPIEMENKAKPNLQKEKETVKKELSSNIPSTSHGTHNQPTTKETTVDVHCQNSIPRNDSESSLNFDIDKFL